MLRLDWNLVFTVINLLILYVLMRKFLFKPVNEILEKRRKKKMQDWLMQKLQKTVH
ncbi:MAG: ATP synthase F0 subunit B [Lachnospiraceae bacterium]